MSEDKIKLWIFPSGNASLENPISSKLEEYLYIDGEGNFLDILLTYNNFSVSCMLFKESE